MRVKVLSKSAIRHMQVLVYKVCVPLIDWISDTLSQGYTNLQSLVKCLDHRNIVSDTVCSQAKAVLGCAMH